MPSRACVHALVQRFEDSMNDIRDKQNGTLMHVAVSSLIKYKAMNNSKVNTVVSIIENILDDLNNIRKTKKEKENKYIFFYILYIYKLLKIRIIINIISYL